jgi:hypothetical protein
VDQARSLLVALALIVTALIVPGCGSERASSPQRDVTCSRHLAAGIAGALQLPDQADSPANPPRPTLRTLRAKDVNVG